MNMPANHTTVEDIAARIPDGALIGVPKEDGGVAMAVTRALIRRNARNLRLVTVPTSGMQADMLIGAGCVSEIETSGVAMGEFGYAPCFRRAAERGAVTIRDATCPAIYAELQAAEKGVPFMALRGLLGSDVLANRPDWRVIDNPFAGGGDPVVLLPALRPDVTLFHARYGDRYGNVWVGPRRETVLLAHAAAHSFATVEEIIDGNLMEDEKMRAGTIPPVYVGAVALAPRGAWPMALYGGEGRDGLALRDYVAAARSEDGFLAWLDTHVFAMRAA